MDLPRAAVRLGTLCVLALLVVLLFWTAGRGGNGLRAYVVQDASGTPLPVPDAPMRQSALWNHQPVMVFVVSVKELDGVDAARGPGSATPSIDVPGHPELRLFVLSAKSTQAGCTVGWNAQLGASKDIADYDGDGQPDGRMLDPCHFGQWDPYHRGAPQPGTPAPARLASLNVGIVGDHLEATVFDGPVGVQR